MQPREAAPLTAHSLHVVKKNRKVPGSGEIFGALLTASYLHFILRVFLSPQAKISNPDFWIVVALNIPILALFIFLFIIPAIREKHLRSIPAWAKATFWWGCLHMIYAVWIFATGTSPSRTSNYQEIGREVGLKPLAIALVSFCVCFTLNCLGKRQARNESKSQPSETGNG